jgi:PAS domain S-box-containing protein
MDLTGHFTSFNQAAAALHGYSRDEFARLTMKDLLTPESHAAAVQVLRQALADGEQWKQSPPREFHLVKKDGTVFDGEIRTRLIWRGEHIVGVHGITRDLTERRQTEAELRRSEERFRQVAQCADEFLWEVDAEGLYTYASPVVEKILGYTPEEMVACRHFYDLFVPQEQDDLKTKAFAVFSRQEVFRDFASTDVHKDGHLVVLQTAGMPVLDPQGNLIGYRGVNTDITDRKRAEEALRKSEAQLSNALKIAKLGAWELDVESGMFAFTDSFYAIFRTTAKDMGGYQMSVADYARRFVHPEDSALVGLETRRALETDDPNYSRYLEHRMLYADGSVGHIAVRFFIVKDHRGKTIKTYGVNQDITERKQVERKQTQLLEQLTAANQELKDFAYVISHDLKAPLRAIGTIVDWLSSDYAGRFDEQGREYLTLLGNRVTRMQNLIDGVLQYSRIGRTEQGLAPVDLSRLLPEIVESLGVPDHIVVEVQPDLPTVEADTTRITQVFQNLLSNAIKYMDKPQGQIAVVCEEEGTFWKFRVTDNGPGIELIHFERIFKLFQTLAPRDTKESTGVGLTIAKKIVEMYGGRIWVESEVGRGSTFFFTFPRRQTSEMEPLPEAAAPGSGGAELAAAEAGHPLTPAGPLERS